MWNKNPGHYNDVTCLALLVVTGCVSGPLVKSPGEEVFYRKENTAVLEVFNLTTHWFASVDARYLGRRDGDYGEFGGSFEVCSDAEYFCLIGGIAAAIPKKFDGQTSWQFRDITCKSAAPLTDDHLVSVDCSRGNWTNRIDYSPARGITSYWSAAEPGQQFSLVSRPGLLARTSR